MHKNDIVSSIQLIVSFVLCHVSMDQVLSWLLPLAVCAVDDFPQALQLRNIRKAAVRQQPAHINKPTVENLLRLLGRSETAQQTNDMILLLVCTGIPPLDQAEDFGLGADWHAVETQRVLNELDGQRAPPRVARYGSELLPSGEHMARHRLDKHLPRELFRDRDLEVLQIVERIREALLADDMVAFMAEPIEKLLVQPVDRVPFSIEAHVEHLVGQHLPFSVGLRDLVEEGHLALVDEPQELRHSLAIALHLVALCKEEGVGPLHRACRAADKVRG
mmetsp:Transcript_39702/g.114199  ORF Transcript_39702/g.114199 Transcript_39702/m.114199 type:complete len:276 (-) Transcript_39702:413-1240(-)